MMTNAQPYHGPKRSQTAPITSLEKILRDTEVTPALQTSPFVRLRLSRMMGTSGAAANVDTKQSLKVQLKQQQFDFAFLVLYGIVWRCRARTTSYEH
ncbi:hypothetical protein ACET3Z_004837 [Daucus carota]